MQTKSAIPLEHQDFSDLCVLVVEDDEIMRLSLEDRLRLEKIPARAVEDLAGAHKQLATGEVDLVITDIRLPRWLGRRSVRGYLPAISRNTRDPDDGLRRRV